MIVSFCGQITAKNAARFGPVGIVPLSAMLFALALNGCAAQPSAPSAPPADTAASPAILNVADAAIAGDDPAMALKISQSVLSANPDDLHALYHEGDAYYALNRCEDAIAAFRLALKSAPASSVAQTGIGRCLLRQNAAAAEQAFTAAVQDDPHNAAALNDLGIARDLQGHYAAATQPYQQSLLLAPGTLPTEVNLGLSFALSGDAADALQYLGPLATGTDASPKIRQDYAAALIAAGRMGEARHVLAIDLPASEIPAFINAVTDTIAAAAQPSAQPGTQSTTQTSIQTSSQTSSQTSTQTPVMTQAPVINPSQTPGIAAPLGDLLR